MASVQADTPLTILHFNDVYEVDERKAEPVGGSARFVGLINSLLSTVTPKPIVLFSGDAFNPSLLSTVTRGKHMPPVLNACHTAASVLGNHDFDHGVHDLEKLIKMCDFPWLLSNCDDKSTGKPLANAVRTLVLEQHGRKIGLMGLIEREWLATLCTLDEDDVLYTDFVESGTQLAAELRAQGCDLIVALTHMRLPNDRILASKVPGIDLILGGHDHGAAFEVIGPVTLCKSACDFRKLSQVSVTFSSEAPRPLIALVKLHEITSDVAPDAAVSELVSGFTSKLEEGMKKRVGTTAVDLDCTFASVRTSETNLGNFITDIMRNGMKSDIALINSGTLRADAILPAGDLTQKDLVRILPMIDELIVLRLTGSQVLEALENGVSQWPKLEGRFPQVSGVSFAFDGSKSSGARVLSDSVMIGTEAIQLEKNYTLVTKAYLAQGKDGYTVFDGAPIVHDAETCPVLPTLIQNHFRIRRVIEKWAKPAAPHDHEDSALGRAIHKFKSGLASGCSAHATEDSASSVDVQIRAKIEGRITNVTV